MPMIIKMLYESVMEDHRNSENLEEEEELVHRWIIVAIFLYTRAAFQNDFLSKRYEDDISPRVTQFNNCTLIAE